MTMNDVLEKTKWRQGGVDAGAFRERMPTPSEVSTDEAHTPTLDSDAVEIVEAAASAQSSAAASVVLLMVAIAGEYISSSSADGLQA